MMTELLQPKSGESIYDPTCGSAGMLISTIAYLKNKGAEWRNVSAYGQEINALTSAIGKMNLFLHGVKDFNIVNDDTLKNPAFIEFGELKKFDMVLANPPYSISQWDRKAFESDKYGRNFLGVPPQSRADYAFIQHILKSMKPSSGRCAILLPHGVLFRAEEKTIRENLVKSDLVECVIGVGKNLFYNSPMEACILICRTKKDFSRKDKILFINAKNEITRKANFSYLEDKHIQKIAEAYNSYKNIEGFSAVVSSKDIIKNGSNLSIPLYIKTDVKLVVDDEKASDSFNTWSNDHSSLSNSLSDVLSMIEGGK